MKKLLPSLLLSCAFFIFNLSSAQKPDNQEIETVFLKGSEMFQTNQFDSGAYYLNKVFPVFEKKQDWEKYFQCKYYLSLYIYLSTRDKKRTLEAFESGLKYAKEKMGEEGAGVGEMYFGLGWLHNNAFRENEIASEYYLKALTTWENAYGTYHEKTAKAYSNYLLILINIKKYREAEKVLNKGLDINEKINQNNANGLARFYNSAFYFYHGLRQLDKSLRFAQVMYQLTEHNPDNQYFSRACRNLSMTYYDLQEYDLAAKYALRELEVRKTVYDDNQIASIYNNLGRIYLFSDPEKAKSYTHDALNLKMIQYGPNAPTTISSQLNYASAVSDTGDPEKAILMYDRILERLNSHDDYTNKLRALKLLTTAYNYAGKWNLSVQTFQKTQDLYLEGIDGKPSADLHLTFYGDAGTYGIASLIENYKEIGNESALLKAHLYFQKTDSILSYVWKGIEYQRDQRSFLNLMNQFYTIASDLYYYLFQHFGDIQYAEKLLYTSERMKTAISFPAFTLALKKEGLGVPTDILRYKQKLELEIETLDVQIDGDKELLFARKNSMDSLLAVIKHAYPSYYDEKIKKYPTLKQFRKSLSKGESALLYITNQTDLLNNQSNIICVFVSRDKVKMWRNETEHLPMKIESFLKSVQGKEKELSHSLFSSLSLDSVMQETTGNRIVVVPSAELFYLPFELLQNKNNQRLIENNIIRYTPSVSMMLASQEMHLKKIENSSLFALNTDSQIPIINELAVRDNKAEPLVGSIIEVNQISKIIGGSNLSGLSKTAILNRLGKSDIIHLATHAVVDHSAPAISKLYLSENADSSIYAYELYNQSFKAQLVTLSACNTGIGKIQKGEGIQSLGKAFTYAGCPNIVMSLWPVNDESTSELMTYFYKNLKSGMRKDEALRKAKLTYLENADPVKAHPYYWAGFVFSGNPEPLEFKESIGFHWLLSLPILLMVGFIRSRKHHNSSSN